MLDRELPQRMRARTDQRAHLAVFAVGMASELERVRPLDDVLRSAATADPGSLGQGACRTTCSKQHAAMITIVRWITTRGPLRGGTDAVRAADLRWTLTNPKRTTRCWKSVARRGSSTGPGSARPLSTRSWSRDQAAR